MTSSYEERIVNAILAMVDCESSGDDSKKGDHLVEALKAGRLLRKERKANDTTIELRSRR